MKYPRYTKIQLVEKNDELIKKVDQLEKEIERLNASIQPLRDQSNKYATILSRISVNEDQIYDLSIITKENNDLKNINEELTKKNTEFQSMLLKQRSEIEDLRNTNIESMKELNKAKSDVKSLQKADANLRAIIRTLQNENVAQPLKDLKVVEKKHFYLRIGFE